MNKREALNLKLSEEELVDDKGREYKTYILNEVEYKLYGDLTSRRLDGELFEEYKIRRYFIQAYNDKAGTMIWFSKNNDTMKWYAMARRIKDVPQDKLNIIKDNTIKTNLGTLNKKKLEEIIKNYAEQS